jgi:hypothetical protein
MYSKSINDHAVFRVDVVYIWMAIVFIMNGQLIFKINVINLTLARLT